MIALYSKGLVSFLNLSLSRLLKDSILVVQNIQCEHLGRFKKLFESDKYDISVIDARNIKNIFPNISDYSGIIILGGPMSVYDNYEYLEEEQNLINKAVDMNIPTLGICLGSQLIAQALGGNVHAGKTKEIGWYDVEITNDGKREIFSGLSTNNVKIFQWHGDTYDLPNGSIILAKSRDYVQAFRIKNAIGIQFHIEVDVNMIKDWINQYSKEIEDSKIPVDSIMPKNLSQIEELSSLCKLVYVNFRDMIEKSKKKIN